MEYFDHGPVSVTLLKIKFALLIFGIEIKSRLARNTRPQSHDCNFLYKTLDLSFP